MKLKRNTMWLIPVLMLFVFGDCSKSSNTSSGGGNGGGGGGGTTPTNDMDVWLTKADQSSVLQKQSVTLSFGSTATSGYPVIDVDSATSYQTVPVPAPGSGQGSLGKYQVRVC